MTRLGVISNARSKRNIHALQAMKVFLSVHPEVAHITFNNIEELPRHLAAMADSGVTHLVINGGDGTVQAAITELVERNPFPTWPRLSLLSGGMTNIIAADAGLTGAPVAGLKNLIDKVGRAEPLEAISRPLLALHTGNISPVVYGFFFGAIAFYQGTMLSRRDIHKLGFTQGLAAKLGVGWSIAKMLWHGPGPRSGFSGEHIDIGIDDAPISSGNYFLILATTLDRLLPGIMPFWGTGEAPIKYTTVNYPPVRFGRAVLPLIRGHPALWMLSNGYESGRLNKLYLRLQTPVVMDGEIFSPHVGHVNLSAGPSVTFYR